jgi:hypothetical protein
VTENALLGSCYASMIIPSGHVDGGWEGVGDSVKLLIIDGEQDTLGGVV